MPFMASREGPALAVGDINGDGLEDVFIGSSRGMKSALYVQGKGGSFTRSSQLSLDNDSTYEDVDACWADVNKDGLTDLIVASGGNEYFGKSEFLLPRVYLNDGKGQLTRKTDAFQDLFITASSVAAYDFTGDGHIDLFIGGRAVPWEYGVVPSSYLLANDGQGKFTDVTGSYAKGLKEAGFVKDAVWSDIDGDKDMDLVLALEWDGICAFKNDKGKLEKEYLTRLKGWWNFVLPVDVDGDGDLDLVAGNEGLNSRFRASEKEPVRLYYDDFDGNGKREQFITYYQQGRELPFANKADLEKQMPSLKKKFLYAEDFANASLRDIFDKSSLDKADVLSANFFPNTLFINEGSWTFTAKPLPWEAQLTSYRDALATDVNADGRPDVIMGGNFYPNNIQMGRYDADYGTLLINLGNGNFKYEPFEGLSIKGSIRHIRSIMLDGRIPAYLLARNDDSLRILTTTYKE